MVAYLSQLQINDKSTIYHLQCIVTKLPRSSWRPLSLVNEQWDSKQHPRTTISSICSPRTCWGWARRLVASTLSTAAILLLDRCLRGSLPFPRRPTTSMASARCQNLASQPQIASDLASEPSTSIPRPSLQRPPWLRNGWHTIPCTKS